MRRRSRSSVTDTGGKVVAAPFDVGDQGKMAVFQDPIGRIHFVPGRHRGMRGFVSHQDGAFDWGELNARNVETALPFYQKVFGWDLRSRSPMPDGRQYHEFQLEGESILGAWEMSAMVPATVPSSGRSTSTWTTSSLARASAAARRTRVVAPQDMPGGRFAIMTDPQGASFGLLHFEAPEGI